MEQTRPVDDEVAVRLGRSHRSHAAHEFFTNTFHFPLVNIILELQLSSGFDYLNEPDLYAMIFAAVVQAMIYGRWQHLGLQRQLLGNLIAPLIYTLLEAVIEGGVIFSSYNHIAYWGFALAIGTAQQVRHAGSEELRDAMILVEGVVRTGIVLVMYAIFEWQQEDYHSFTEFMDDGPHQFLMASIPLLGLVFGFANINSERYLSELLRTAARLRQFSEWYLGRDLLSRAVNDPGVLGLRRVDRTMLFMDIRGFTAWSEQHSPEEVVALMNGYYEAAESVWKERNAIKVKLTADEVMLVFETPAEGVWAAAALQMAANRVLETEGLAAGIGIHIGPVVEGVMGGRDHKNYDLLGDSVNTAKRICDKAGGGEVLVSDELHTLLYRLFEFGTSRAIQAKGKQEPLTVWPLSGWHG